MKEFFDITDIGREVIEWDDSNKETSYSQTFTPPQDMSNEAEDPRSSSQMNN